MTYQEVIEYLYNSLPMYHRVGMAAYKEDITNTEKLMEALDHPERKIKTIHVAGTNGKGSVSHFLASILQNSGYKVGLYTSPHLIDFRERIRINGQMVSEQYVEDFVNANKPLFDEVQPSFFEMTVAMAFTYFAEQEVDIAVIEVGMGGRLDSTNVITPLLSIITNIGFDHTQYLGTTLPAIAKEKAGIIKKGVPIVVGETQNEVEYVFLEKAKEMQSNIYFADRNFELTLLPDSTDYYMHATINKSEEYFSEIKTPLAGRYQVKNVATVSQAVELLRDMKYNITDMSFRIGVESVVIDTGLHGRWEVVSTSPTIVCETAHNEDGIKNFLIKINSMNYDTLHIVYGCVNDKDYEKILIMLPSKAKYYFCTPSVPRGLDVNILHKSALNVGLDGERYSSPAQALEAASYAAKPGDVVVVTGSIFLVADVLRELGKPKEEEQDV